MNQMTSKAQLIFDKNSSCYSCRGAWSILHLGNLAKDFNQSARPHSKTIKINGQAIQYLDSAGALILTKCINTLKKEHNEVVLVNFNEQQQNLLQLISDNQGAINHNWPLKKTNNLLYQIGYTSINKLNQLKGLISLVGELSERIFYALQNWRRLQIPSITANIYTTGISALPIIALLSFLIGVVLAYQMGLQLETYGANIFIAYLSGMAIFREFSPLITAIIVAGRTSSAFTAQIGSMKINEEIDALLTMGLSPIELLVAPKLLGLLLIFPLLIFWSDLFSTLGAMYMSKFMLNVGYIDFLNRLHDSIGLKQMMLGLYKAPIFALLIALVGCFQGFQVGSSATSVGTQTTKSVVQALFLIIIADAAYSIVYSWLGL
ncbi:MAG: MlaE family ABC transporter permease [Legionella sp.]